ncbi:uncharacterized protein LOC134815296 [Bolinopsis microptera]|uniref:uncharacterized protein LOC134815296 n=1 Tax=Bolinopsis microptera TaxID=2820187 RepID=UPI00307AE8B9
MRLVTCLYIALACICLVEVAQTDLVDGETVPDIPNTEDSVLPDKPAVPSDSPAKGVVVLPDEPAEGVELEDEVQDDVVKEGVGEDAGSDPTKVDDINSGSDDVAIKSEVEAEESETDEKEPESETNEQQKDENDQKGEEGITDKKDDLNDNPQVVDPDTISEETDARFHTVKLMLYIIAPVSALVVIYFIMKGLKGNSHMFLNRYHIVGARGDNIELRPLGYESDDEEDIVFDSARQT